MNRYAWNTALIEPFTRMSLRGIRWDRAAAKELRQSLEPRVWEAQARVDELAGVMLPSSTAGLLEAASACFCHKVRLKKQLKGYTDRILIPEQPPVAITVSVNGIQSDNVIIAKKRRKYEKHVVPPRPLTWQLMLECANLGQDAPLKRLRHLSEEEQTPSIRAEIAALLEVGINVESPDQVIATLDRLGLPAKWKRGQRNPEDPNSGRTSDEESLLDLLIKTGHAMPKALLEARGLRTATSFLDSMQVDDDGRVRCSFANPGSETGRVLTRTWHSGSGGNLQAVSIAPFNFPSLLVCDEGKRMAQCDLKAADAWTVAARCAQQGDPTMLNDMQAGVRIPSLIALLMAGVSIPKDHKELAALCKTVKKDWRDYAYKKGTYLSFYMGSASLIQRETVRESWSETGTPVDPGIEFCSQVQGRVLSRYWGLRGWWADVERQVRRDGTLRGASGQVREFMSRRWTGSGAARRLDHSSHKEAVASEPQMVTTYATNLALWRLWTDPENIAPDGTRIIEPLLHVHDSILAQFPEDRGAWAGRKLAEWFNNPIRVGSMTINIPVESVWGPSWGDCKQPFPL